MKEMTSSPPRLFIRFFRWFCHPKIQDYIEGDLMEVYERRLKESGKRKADSGFIIDVLLLFRPGIIKPLAQFQFSNSFIMISMFKNYFITTLRSVARHRTYSFINLTGLTLGLVSSMLIFQYVTFEKSADSFHKKADRIYRIAFKRMVNDSPEETASQLFFGAAEAFAQEITDIQRFTRTRADFFQEGPTISYILNGERTGFKDIRSLFVDSAFLSVFTFPFAEGNPQTALRQPEAILLTQSTARKIFGDENPIGKTIEYGLTQGLHTFTVTGVLRDVPANSHIQFDVLIPMETYLTLAPELANAAWKVREFTTYVEAQAGADIQKMEEMMTAIIARNVDMTQLGDNSKLVATLQPLRELYFDRETDLGMTGFGSAQVSTRTGNERMVYFFGVIGIMTLAISLMSYVNLSTVRSLDRAKEVGIRKVVGASKGNLAIQFFLESAAMNIAALILASLLIVSLMPTINSVLHTNFSLDNWFSKSFIAVFGSIFLLGVFLSGLYPTAVLSSFRPITSLNARTSVPVSGINIKKVLVIMQYTPAIALLVCTIIVVSQLNFMLNMDVGLKMEKLVTVRTARFLPEGMTSREAEAVLKREVQKLASVDAVTFSGNQAGRGLNFSIPFSSKEGAEGLHYVLGSGIDHDFSKVYGLRLLAGEPFLEDMIPLYGDEEQFIRRILINVTAMNILGFQKAKDAIGNIITSAENQRFYIHGVLDDFNWSSAHKSTDPVMLWYRPANRFMTIKISTANLSGTLKAVKNIYSKLFPEDVFYYEMADEVFKRQYGDDRQFASLFGVFSGIAIVVASLGLFGLSAFSTGRRSKEIGIRKVLGATVNSIVHLLSKEFLLLVLISFVIASPFAWIVMRKWLHTFAFHIEITAFPFLIAGLGALLISLLAVIWKAVSAATCNPTNILKHE